ncbi:hypothetical protein [Streptomyces viridosporus]|uniref:hypothetical protein n=1 Tax=Streptomyces viridosporus TaxID=67581 RepID=UPI0036FE80F8
MPTAKRPRSQRPRLPETSKSQKHARHAWNKGLTGEGRPAADTPVVEVCTVDGCGTTADQPKPAAAMRRIHVPDSREPARWYCPGRCAAIGRARADLATITPALDEREEKDTCRGRQPRAGESTARASLPTRRPGSNGAS